jgi:antitoxin ParD1/3/4
MESMNISLPEPMKQYVDEQVNRGSYSSASEYMRELVRADQQRREKERLEALLLEALDSGEPIEVTPEMIEDVRSRLRVRAKNRQRDRR